MPNKSSLANQGEVFIPDTFPVYVSVFMLFYFDFPMREFNLVYGCWIPRPIAGFGAFNVGVEIAFICFPPG